VALVDREAAEAMQKPALNPSHFVEGNHEATVPPGDAAACRQGQQQGIPTGPVGWGQQQRTAAGQIFTANHFDGTEEGRQGQVLGDSHGQGR
jgi:hypothetical protein